MTSFLSASAAGSRSASIQKRANTGALLSVPDFVAVITTRLGFSRAAIDPPLELVILTIS